MVVCFIGHRKIENKDALSKLIEESVSALIEQGADSFLFGSRSDFNSLCWEIVTKLQEQHPNIKRISYNAPHETAFTSKEEREEFERLAANVLKQEIHSTDYESAVDASDKTRNANKNAYIMRKQEMIDDSDVCVFYYNENYLPPKRKAQNRYLPDYQPKSGTAIAYTYAKKKKNKIIINLYN